MMMDLVLTNIYCHSFCDAVAIPPKLPSFVNPLVLSLLLATTMQSFTETLVREGALGK
jgi:hypothetical protein